MTKSSFLIHLRRLLNRSWRIKGYSADEILGRHFSVFYPPDAGICMNGLPPHPLGRREFLSGGGRAAVALLLTGVPPRAAAAPLAGAGPARGTTGRVLASPRPHDAQHVARDRAAPFGISLAQWSLHRAIRAGTIDHLDFARIARVDFGIDAIEYVNTFFKDRAQDAAYLADMNQRAADHGVIQHLIMCDGEGRLGDPDASLRTQAIENHYRWVEAARVLGCATIRVNAASRGTWDEQASLAADGLRRLTEFAADADINVVVENHGGLSSNGRWLAQVIGTVAHPRCGTLPDFGNFNLGDGTTYDPYVGVAELMPFAKAVSAKSHDFDDAGEETTKDYRRLMRIVLDAGYSSWVGIEYEGNRLSEHDGIRATLRLLRGIQDDPPAGQERAAAPAADPL